MKENSIVAGRYDALITILADNAKLLGVADWVKVREKKARTLANELGRSYAKDLGEAIASRTGVAKLAKC